MCDTLTALAPTTLSSHALFAKNSDRERNEAQVLEMSPARTALRGARLKLTYVEIDEVQATHPCLLSRPCWMWGAEMGANSHGVVIGNEAMHSVVPAQRDKALTGMDLVRLGLERGATAAEAVQVITGLLEQHGQGGNCGHLNPFYYHNGFIIADPHEAYVLETVGRWWIVEKVEGARSLSNALSIGKTRHAISPDLLAHARAEGWTDEAGHFEFADHLIDPVKDAGTFGRGRCSRAAALLAARGNAIELADMISVLRDHGEEADGDPDWSPAKTRIRSICMHAASGARRSQSVASMASDLTPGRITHWMTGTSAPCLSLFKPVVVGIDLPMHGPAPTDKYDGNSLWWRHERFHRAALRTYPDVLRDIVAQRDAVEQGFRNRMAAAWEAGQGAVEAALEQCWREAGEVEADWLARVAARPQKGPSAIGRAGALAWARLNATAGFHSD